MKDKYIEEDGKLFMDCMPEPLERDSQVPCLIRPIQDDTRMGELNRISLKDGLEKFVLYDVEYYIGDGYYLRFEIVGKHCPEGSREWALWQMLNGKKVKHKRDATNYYYMDKNGMLVSKGEQIIEDESRWLKTSSRNGWKIYEEPKPKPEVGKWYQHKKRKHYACVVAVNGEECRIRFAGNPEGERYGWKENSFFESSYEPASLEPDFSNAKTGDKCYSVLVGDMKISCVFRHAEYGVNAYHEKSGLSARYTNAGIYDRHHIHPALFNSVEQCAAYFAEVALKMCCLLRIHSIEREM